jgi:hypothetical protein
MKLRLWVTCEPPGGGQEMTPIDTNTDDSVVIGWPLADFLRLNIGGQVRDFSHVVDFKIERVHP